MCYTFFRKKLIDGQLARGPLMRRKVDGRWEYRKMTPEEEAEYMNIEAW